LERDGGGTEQSLQLVCVRERQGESMWTLHSGDGGTEQSLQLMCMCVF
jgi:hypothetical protein